MAADDYAGAFLSVNQKLGDTRTSSALFGPSTFCCPPARCRRAADIETERGSVAGHGEPHCNVSDLAR
jgi:hypothetical protein